MKRRSFLALTVSSTQFLMTGALLGACGGQGGPARRDDPAPAPAARPSAEALVLGPLQEPDANGIRLPAGFSSRVVARSGQALMGTAGHRWHWAPDGGAVFTAGGGWIYVSNSELDNGRGGVSALSFDGAGRLMDAYPVLEGTSRNCSGGATPWGTWLSCEEVAYGLVWECDPTGRSQAVACPALGRFSHEAVTVDPVGGRLYLTEDVPDGRWYRFTPERARADGGADLSSGVLEVARVSGGSVSWLRVDDPSAAGTPTRYQVPRSSAFDGGEGSCWYDGTVYFSTKGDNRVWAYDVASARLAVVYYAATAAQPILRGVDNMEAGPGGELLVAEDGDDMQIVMVTAHAAVPLLQLTGHRRSEITGPAFTPDYQRLYFSSQRGATGRSSDGVTYEISGPFVP